MVDLLSVPPRGRQHLVLRVDAGLRSGEPTPLGDVFAARTSEYGRKMNGELSGLRTPPVPPTMGGAPTSLVLTAATRRPPTGKTRSVEVNVMRMGEMGELAQLEGQVG